MSLLYLLLIPLLYFAVRKMFTLPDLPAELLSQVYIPPEDRHVPRIASQSNWLANYLSGHAQQVFDQSGNVFAVPDEWQAEARRRGKRAFAWRLAFFRWVVNVVDTKDAQHLLVGNASNYIKPAYLYKTLELFLGKRSILNIIDPHEHAKVRLVVGKAFSPYVVKNVFGQTVIPKHVTKFCDDLEKEVSTSSENTTTKHMEMFEDLTLNVVIDAAYRADRVENNKTLSDLFRKMGRVLTVDYKIVIGTPENVRRIVRFLFPYANRIFAGLEEAVAQIDAATVKIIDEAKKVEQKDKEHDRCLIDVMLRAQSENPSTSDYVPTNDDIISNCSLFEFAGSETTAKGLFWTTSFLAHNPKIQDQLFDELRDAVSPRAAPIADDVANCKFLENVIKETLRLVPPVSASSRWSLKDDVLPSGLKIPKGTEIALSFCQYHHDEFIWGADVMEFNPARWDDDEKMAKILQTQCAYMPFMVGSRNCVGMALALTEMKIAVAFIVRRFKIEVGGSSEDERRSPCPVLALTSAPDAVRPLKFTIRNDE